MTLDVADIEPLIDAAQRLMAPASAAEGMIREHVETNGAIVDLPEPLDHDPARVTGPQFAAVDGAVADEQADALVWVTAVGVAQTEGRADHVATASAVAPVSSDTDRLRSALMASCELSAALACDDRTTCIDGGLATPLISIAQGLTVGDPDVAAAINRHYDKVAVVDVVDSYISRVIAGEVVALPKQDTATGYLDEWASALGDRLDTAARASLARLRDRPVVTSLLQPGQMLRPRRAVELSRTESKSPDTHAAAAGLAASYRRLGQANNVHVAYVKPRRLPTRVIKFEYLEDDPSTYSTGLAIASALDEQTLGPRMKEPLLQHQVDATAKRLVTSNLASILGLAGRALDDPSATVRYRT